MAGTKNRYTGLSIEDKRYDRIRREFDSIVSKSTDLTFTEWSIRTLESSVTRIGIISKMFPRLKLINFDSSVIIIDDTEKNIAVKVYWNDQSIDCSVQEGKDRYILFAMLHPHLLFQHKVKTKPSPI